MNEIPRDELPAREIPHVWISMRDGTRLAARLWLPHDAEQHPVPAILEYLPYRQGDLSMLADSRQHPYFAGYGYASLRVDLRGTGNSEGVLPDEYLSQEQDDALDILEWLAEQSWCNGSVGMLGISWGGFNSLQVAARRPPPLKAIISIGSSDDRYSDDVHYIGGALLASNMLSWAAYMLCINALPPDPRIVGDRWREMWRERLEQLPYVNAWLSHPRRDAYWKHGSLCENYAAISCPVYVVGGWADGYTNSVLRLLEHLKVPHKGLIGPWSHDYAFEAIPGPQIGFLQECVRWWDYWLKGIENGIMDEPMLRVWLQESVTPQTYYAEMPGRWITEPAYPSANITLRDFFLNANGLSDAPALQSIELTVCSPQSTGLDAGEWCPHGYPGEMPGDQRADDGRSLCFDSAPFDTPVEILGFPQLTLTIAADRPIAFMIARLCDVAPDGASLLVSRGVLNLTHRDSHAHPSPLEPNIPYTISFALNAAGHSLAVGHRWRLALSTTYWHYVFPAPEPVTATIFCNDLAHLTLPVRAPRAGDAAVAPFGEPECAAPVASVLLRPPAYERRVTRDLTNQKVQFTNRVDSGARQLLDAGIEYESRVHEVFSIREDDPLSAHITSRRMRQIKRAGSPIRVETFSTMRADAQTFYVTNRLEAYEGETRVFERDHEFSTPRDLM